MQRARCEIESTTAIPGDLPLIGLSSERRRVEEALLKHESLLLLGPRGCGKTRLLHELIRSLSSAPAVVYTRCPAVLHDLLIALACSLLESRHHTLARMTSAGPNPETWLSRQTSVHLRGMLWNPLEAEPRTLVLDEIEGAGARTFRFLQRLYYARGMAMIAASRDLRALGDLGRLFWDPRRILQFQPLADRESLEVFELAANRFDLRELDLEEFRDKVLESARGNAGQIIEMCRLATDPQYISGTHIKFAPLRIDTMIKFAG